MASEFMTVKLYVKNADSCFVRVVYQLLNVWLTKFPIYLQSYYDIDTVSKTFIYKLCFKSNAYLWKFIRWLAT